MTDRELLEAAAKAAGHELSQAPDEGFVRAHIGDCWRPKWNPLESDGDALRLAVKLRIVIQHESKYVVAVFDNRRIQIACHEDNGINPYAATCRAIVRAAAEIGKAA